VKSTNAPLPPTSEDGKYETVSLHVPTEGEKDKLKVFIPVPEFEKLPVVELEQ
jgi:hypothetical protein